MGTGYCLVGGGKGDGENVLELDMAAAPHYECTKCH